ncbi:trifunctional serine/threonine-protein kinase/ATP-binding protein/sensor histidine kinase [Mastigocoleus testarum]|uniref:histidine kinase n=1 Tax=Mastigocoleus testarum BC008 TaxID=371196 RepID=A0A0V7ZTR7_9CYAN|nr:ATP-binding sensor histidine kinase [Mastigocoleus testarum]KST68037.1 serine/threonine protein kinase [Mastigocoleus testarum BC008]KST68338.1 serine/threonine protein kinase [Mastigocoleus testarum BC008]
MTTVLCSPIIPKYQICEQLYQGSRTKVYRAIRKQDSLPVVIKLLTSEYPSFNELLQFRNQYFITKKLNVPGIISPLSLETHGNGYILVMEDKGEISLREYIKNNNLSLIEFLSIAIQLTDILYQLYQNLIIHKDIKPDNILINAKTKQVKLIDFSIASLLSKETQEIKNPNILEGTLAYLSPEQTGRMNRGIDYRSDFYSLGITFFELLTGELPFKSDDAMELVHCHIAQTLPSIDNGNLAANAEKIPQVLSDIVTKLMAKNAEDRYQTALGLKYDLENCLKQLRRTGKIKDFPIAQKDVCDRFIIPEKLYGREAEVKILLEAFNRVSGIENNSNNHTLEKYASSSEPSDSQLKSELMLIAGFSGIGKTAVVKEVHKPIVKQHGYFIKGKFDQFNRNIPFSAFVQAFRDLMGQLLSESDAQLSSWKHKILQALGENGQVIIEVIPELEKIIGKQPSVPELSGSAVQNRFNLLFQNFIQVFTSKEHPLVIFLDDLQWADSASLKLMQLLVGELETSYLLMIGAYRDNEVFSAHPLILTLDGLKKTEAKINTIILKPLSKSSLTQLVADTLSCNPKLAQPLTDIVYQKTQGNPFFATQFIKALYEDGLICFDSQAGYWQCDITKVREVGLTDDVVEFMATQLQKLPTVTQDILQLAACISNQFDLATLAMISDKSEIEAADALWEALQSGLIVPEGEMYKFYLRNDGEYPHTSNTKKITENVSYRFLHDRVQQAAYSLIPDKQKQITHYHIGQILLESMSSEAREDRIFELVNQLNHGTALIIDEKELDELIRLNLQACRKARNASAYQAGLEYAKIGLSLLGDKVWQGQIIPLSSSMDNPGNIPLTEDSTIKEGKYEESLEFHELAAELAFLCGEFEVMEQLIEAVIKHAESILEQVNIYLIRIQANISQNKLTKAIAIAQELLQQLGVSFPETITHKEIQNTIADIDKLIDGRKIEDFAHLPVMSEQEKIAIVRVANSVIPIACICGSPLYPLLVVLSVKLSIQYGNISASSVAYASYGIIACTLKQDVDTGVKFGQLALQVFSQLDAKAIKPAIFNAMGLFILHRKSHLKETLPLLQEGYKVALEVGNQEMAGYNAKAICFHSFWCSQTLGDLEQETRAYCNGLVKLNQLATAGWCQIYWQTILNLLGRGGQTANILSGEALQEGEFLPLLVEAHDFFGLFIFNLYKLMLCYLFGEIEAAQNHAIEVRRYLLAAVGMVAEPAFYFYDSLSILATLSSELEHKPEVFVQIEENQTQLHQQWARYAPMNHQHKVDLVEAEKCRVLGQKAEAIDLYDKAISGAKANHYLQEEAIAKELAAKFYLDWGKERIAADYMQEAYYSYALWGAKAKTDDLEKCYPQLLVPILRKQHNQIRSSEATFEQGNLSSFINQTLQTTYSSSSTISQALDFATVLKASQALSSEIHTEKLISKLMQVVMENAGALKSALILLKDSTAILKALATPERGVELVNIPYQESTDIPTTVLNNVKRSLKIVVLDDAIQQNDFLADSYLRQQQPKSLLCMPILNQSKLIGLLYLENKLTTGAFTRDRVSVLNLLITQVAISLENAQLYGKLEDYSHTLEQKVSQRTLQLTQKATELESTLEKLYSTQAQLIQAEKMSGLGQLVAGIAHEINNPINFIYGNLTPATEYVESLIELIHLYQISYPQPLPTIQSKIADIELDFLIDDLPKLLASMGIGARRISEIVLSLRNFSRLDEAEMKPVDIHSGIDSTLLILQHQFTSNSQHAEIEIIKKYKQIPRVYCYASELNQVFMHVISNAIGALLQKMENTSNFDKPRITICTSLKEDSKVLISIADNGIGINKAILNKIFDPFFTTKPVGNGKGLGLSISYSIVVEKHGGNLSCISSPSEGTEFLIELPLKQ